jgi:spore maturation protein CgeB
LCDDTRGELSKQFGDTVATYHSPDDLRDKIAFYMEHETERLQMAGAARARVQGCSFVDRAQKIVIPFLQEVLDGR